MVPLEQPITPALERQQLEESQGHSELSPLTHTSSGSSTRPGFDLLKYKLAHIATGSNLPEPTTPASQEPVPWLADDLHAGSPRGSVSSATTPLRPLELGKDPTRARTSGEPDVVEAVAEASGELSRIRLHEHATRRLRAEPRDDAHTPSDVLKAKFKEYMEMELEIRTLSTRDWLITATWWLLKVSTRHMLSSIHVR